MATYRKLNRLPQVVFKNKNLQEAITMAKFTGATTDPNGIEVPYVNQLLKTIDELAISIPTLRAIAAVLVVPSTRLYAVAKQPQEGKVYNKNEYNYDAVDRFIERRLDPEKGYGTVLDLIVAAQAMDVTFESEDGRKSLPGVSNAKKITLADGTEVIGRKLDLVVGSVVYLRKDESNTQYTVVVETLSHVVLRAGEDDLLVLMSNNTANWKLQLTANAPATEPVA